MCSTIKAHLQYKRECEVQIRHIIGTNEDVQYWKGKSSVRKRMCSTSEAYFLYKRGCETRVRHIIRTNDDVRYWKGKSSVRTRMCSANEDVQCERGCAVRTKHIFITSQYELCAVRASMCNTCQDVQHESVTSSVGIRMCSSEKAHYQYE